MLCPKCGRDNHDSNNYCPNCGTLLKSTSLENANSGIAIGSGGDTKIGGDAVGRDKIIQIEHTTKVVSGLGRDVPLLKYHYRLDPNPDLELPNGILFTDRGRNDGDHPPTLYVSFYFGVMHVFGSSGQPRKKYLAIHTNMRPALSMTMEIVVVNDGEIRNFMECLGDRSEEGRLIGETTDKEASSTEALSIWREGDETRILIGYYTPTTTNILVPARLSPESVEALRAYLDGVGFGVSLPPLPRYHAPQEQSNG